MPNVEHAKKTQKHLLEKTHTLIAKTRFAYSIFTEYYRNSARRAPRIVYIGHSSLDPLVLFGDNLPIQNFSNVFHANGLAGTKGTAELVKCWLQHPEWPTLTVLGHPNEDKIPKGIIKPENIKLIEKVGFKELVKLQRESAIHVYPAEREGFGHALNEARASGALLLTTNFGPMDEFVHDGYSGFFIDIKKETVEETQLFSELRPVQVQMDYRDICSAMEKVFQLSMDDRKKMGQVGRAAFLTDRMYFIETVNILKNEALKLFQGKS